MRTFGPIPSVRKRGREGVAAVEFALVGPILVLLLIGIVVYGGWFLMAQSVQALASEGARAATRRMSSITSRGTSAGRKRRMERREVIA